MKKITVIVLMLFTALSYAQVGINIATPHTSSALDVTSTSAGFLPPRMTALQRAEIVNPALGLMVFCTNCASGDGELQVYYVSGWKNAAGGDITDPPQIGDYRDGGIVFYIASPPADLDGDGDLDTGLVCAIKNQTTIQWYNGTPVQTSATGIFIGTGASNTTQIINSHGNAVLPETYAAGLARAYDGGGYNDWFLPSWYELERIFINREAINTAATADGVEGDVFPQFSYYWSSTEIDVDNAKQMYFYNGTSQTTNKGNTHWVRAVRAF